MAKDINFFRAEYIKQQKLEKIINKRILIRPNVKKWQVIALFAILPFLLFLSIYLPITMKFNFLVEFVVLLFLIFILIETYLRFCFLVVVKYYQAVAKEETRRRCKCIPSCSEYAIICFKKIFPLLFALLKIRKRLFKTCNGEEFKIDFPIKKMGESFEKKL